jgi:hypothetical protein
MNGVGIERRGGPESGEATQIATHFSAKSDEFQILMQIVKLLLELFIRVSPSAVCNKGMCRDCHRDSKWQTGSITRQIKGMNLDKLHTTYLGLSVLLVPNSNNKMASIPRRLEALGVGVALSASKMTIMNRYRGDTRSAGCSSANATPASDRNTSTKLCRPKDGKSKNRSLKEAF